MTKWTMGGELGKTYGRWLMGIAFLLIAGCGGGSDGGASSDSGGLNDGGAETDGSASDVSGTDIGGSDATAREDATINPDAACIPESDAQFCARSRAECGEIEGADNCGGL